MSSHARAKLDQLIDWYEKNRPEHREPIRIAVRRRTAMSYGAHPEKRGGELLYRGHAIVPRETPPRSRGAQTEL